jgi:hypothetical protein
MRRNSSARDRSETRAHRRVNYATIANRKKRGFPEGF